MLSLKSLLILFSSRPLNQQNKFQDFFAKLFTLLGGEETKRLKPPAKWKIWQKYPQWREVAIGLDILPQKWQLTPLRDKRPYRENWQTETPVSRGQIKQWLEQGEQLISQKTGNPYTAYISGYGLRTGEASGGILATDFDGLSTHPLWEAIKGTNPEPETVAGSSGKVGRKQTFLQIPAHYREQFKDFNRIVLNQWGEIECDHYINEKGRKVFTEGLEFRYNGCQSALPPSRHPETGNYFWLNSPVDTEVAIAPDWLCEFILQEHKKEQVKNEQEEAEKARLRELRRQERQLHRISGQADLESILEDSVNRLGLDTYNWNGHHFHELRNHLEGCCPNHQSQSGRSFHVNIDTLEWYCFGCQVGGHAVEYRQFVKTGHTEAKGHDFVDIVKELANEAGVDIPQPQWDYFSQSEPNPIDYEQFSQWLEEQEKIEQAIVQQENYHPIIPLQFIPIYAFCDHAFNLIKRLIREEQIGEKQIPLNTIVRQADLTLNTDHYRGEQYPIPKTGLLMINAYKKWGKSRFINNLINEWKVKRKPIISIVPRILLGKNQVSGWQLRYIDQKGVMKIEDYPTLALCYDSLGKIANKNLEGALIILDETRQGLKHLYTSSTLEERRSYVLRFLEDKFPEVVKTGGLIIGADADLTELEISHLEKLAQTKAFLINNEYVPQKGKVIFNTGKPDDTLSEILERFKDGENLTIFCEHKSDSKAIYDRLKKLEKEAVIWLINGDTSEKPEVKAIIENDINVAVKEQKPRALIFTTSMSTGISIDGHIDGICYPEVYHHFSYQFSFCHGDTLEPVDDGQALVRVRKDLDMTIYCGEGKIRNDELRSCDPERIKQTLFKKTNYIAHLTQMTEEMLEEKLGREVNHYEVYKALIEKIDPKTGMTDDPHLDYYSKAKARENYNKKHFQFALRQQLIDEGHTLIDAVTEELNREGDLHREIKKDNQWEEAEKIANAEDITLEEAQEIQYRNATKEEREQATKAFLKAELPEVELTPSFVHKAIIKDRRRWLNAVKLFWFYQHPEIAKELDTAKFFNKLKQFSNGVIYLPDLKSILPAIYELKAVGLFDLFNLNNDNEQNVKTFQFCTSYLLKGVNTEVLPWLILRQSGQEISKDDPRVKAFMQKALFRKYKLYTAMGITVTRQTDPIKLIQRLLARVGLKLKNSRTKTINGRKIRYYSLDTSVLNNPDRIRVLQALDRRFLSENRLNTEIAESSTHQSLEKGQDSHQKDINIGVLSSPVEDGQGQNVTENHSHAMGQKERFTEGGASPTTRANLESVETQGLEDRQDTQIADIKIGVLSLEEITYRLNWTQTFEEYLKVRDEVTPHLEVIFPQLWPAVQKMLIYWEGKIV